MILIAAAGVALAATSSADLSPEFGFLARRVGVEDTRSFVAARADLNGDGRPEVIVYVAAPDACGSGGCPLYVLTRDGRRVRLVYRTTITRPPIRVLGTRTGGWRDLAAAVGGGGLQPRDVKLRYKGMGAFLNPSLEPATTQTGEVIIGRAAVEDAFQRAPASRDRPTFAGPRGR